MRVLEGHTGSVTAIAFSADGARLTSGGKDGRVITHFLDTASLPHIFEVPSGWASGQDVGRPESIGRHFVPAEQEVPRMVWALAANPANGEWAVAQGHGAIIVSSTGALVERPAIASATYSSSLAYCDNGRLLVVGYGNSIHSEHPGSVSIYRVHDHREMAHRGATHGVLAVAALPAGKRVLWGGGDRRVTRWDLTAQDHRMTQPHLKEIRAIALSPDGQSFAATDDYAIRIYDSETMQSRREIVGHKGRVTSLAYTPDGRLLSGAWDKSVRVWEPESGREMAAHDWGLGNVRAVAVAPDGLLAAAGGDRGTIILWDLDS